MSIAQGRFKHKRRLLLSKDLKQRGFVFVGLTTIYAHMQAVGMVNDHTTDCFRYVRSEITLNSLTDADGMD